MVRSGGEIGRREGLKIPWDKIPCGFDPRPEHIVTRHEPRKRVSSFGLRPRLVALVLAAVAPFVFLITMVAQQNRSNERLSAEESALGNARALADRIDSRFGAIETVILTLTHSVSPNPRDSLQNDKLLRDVLTELPPGFAHFAVTTLDGRVIGTSDTLPNGHRRAIAPGSGAPDTTRDFDIHAPAPIFGATGPSAIAISHTDSSLRVRMIGFMGIDRLQHELMRASLPSGSIATVVDPRGTVILRSRNSNKWLGRRVERSALFNSSRGRREGIAAVSDIEGDNVFSGYVTASHVSWIVHVGSPKFLALAKERSEFWRALGFGAIALALAIVLAWTQASRIIAPIRKVVRDALLLSNGDLSHRSALATDTDEIGVLGTSLNAMAETLQKREEALKRSEMRFRAIIENVDDVIIIARPDGSRTYVSPAMARVLGYREEELLAFNARDMIHPADWPAVRELIRDVQTTPGTTLFGQARYRHRNGSWRIMDVSLTNLSEVAGVDGLLVNLRDVTEHVTLETELRQAQKMESVGQLAGGVAHDFNNLLTVISGRIDFLLGASNLERDQEDDLTEIKKAADRAASLTQQLLAFSRKQLLQPRVVDLNRTLDDVEPMLRRLIGEDIQIRIEHGADLGFVTADPGQLQQILMNLALNARDAMPSGGVLTFVTANHTVRNEADALAAKLNVGDYVMLQVSDTGVGMDQATQARIFEPFFTTKGHGRGTGLGLSTVYGIVKQSGAAISVTSAPQAGTTFKVSFPRTDACALAKPAVEDELSPPLGTETILLVEDDSAVRELVERVLRSRGYSVLAAQHGGDALQLASDPAKEMDLVLTDIVMPAMSGRELVEALQNLRPTVRVLYMSGYTNDEILRRGLHDPNTSFIQKPFTAENLAVQVRKVLDAA
jgi:PAS domain S-box-containing protein